MAAELWPDARAEHADEASRAAATERKRLMTARVLADRTTSYDNSRAAKPFRVVAMFERGRLVGTAVWPAWAPRALLG